METVNRVISKWKCWRNPSLLLCATMRFQEKSDFSFVTVPGDFIKASVHYLAFITLNILLLKRFFLSSAVVIIDDCCSSHEALYNIDFLITKGRSRYAKHDFESSLF